MTNDEIAGLAEVKDKAAAGAVRFTRHALVRCEQRGITTEQVISALVSADACTGQGVGRFVVPAQFGDRDALIVAVNLENVLIVTVMWRT